MGMLIIEENMGTKGGQYILLWHTAKEERLVHTHTPAAKCLDSPFMGGYAARSHKCRTDRRLFLGLIDVLKIGESRQEICKGPLG